MLSYGGNRKRKSANINDLWGLLIQKTLPVQPYPILVNDAVLKCNREEGKKKKKNHLARRHLPN